MIKKVSIGVLLSLCLLGTFSSAVLAADPSTGGLVTCGKEPDATTAATSCNFAAAIAMINRLITYLIYIALPIAAISFAYAGWLYLSAGDNSGQISKARTIFMDVGVGFILILSAWLIFKLVETTFLSPTYAGKTYLN